MLKKLSLSLALSVSLAVILSPAASAREALQTGQSGTEAVSSDPETEPDLQTTSSTEPVKVQILINPLLRLAGVYRLLFTGDNYAF